MSIWMKREPDWDQLAFWVAILALLDSVFWRLSQLLTVGGPVG
ncbi:hypothetical protein GCM10010411_75380 [Actinomadura fulvescens]|uniref:Uncharacterized protein n=1 Tax=Actinomadura fulvescens TaxID=46160 RepID=A0ABN3QID2_9ACTN